MAIEIVDLPIKNGWIFHRFLYVYQRVVEKGEPLVWARLSDGLYPLGSPASSDRRVFEVCQTCSPWLQHCSVCPIDGPLHPTFIVCISLYDISIYIIYIHTNSLVTGQLPLQLVTGQPLDLGADTLRMIPPSCQVVWVTT